MAEEVYFLYIETLGYAPKQARDLLRFSKSINKKLSWRESGELVKNPPNRSHYSQFSRKNTSQIMQTHSIVSNLPEKTKQIVFGYINKLYLDTSHCLPIDVANMILFYYGIYLQFHTKQHGKYLKFINHKVVKIIQSNNIYSTCLFGEQITNKICNKFYFNFKIHSLRNRIDFFFGYVTSNNCIKDWDQCLAVDDNKNHSTSLFVHHSNYYFRLYHKHTYDHGQRLKYKSVSKFRNDDIFGLSFDFINDNLQIYHNNNKADKISLNGNKSVIPAISLYLANDSIEILQYEISYYS